MASQIPSSRQTDENDSLTLGSVFVFVSTALFFGVVRLKHHS